VRADLLAASKVYESGKKKDLALRFYLAIRSLLHEVERLEKEASKNKESQAGLNKNHGGGINEGYNPQPQPDGQYQN